MKQLAKLTLLVVILSSIFGCATSSEKFETRLPPPEAFNPVFLQYKEFPGQKVMVVAIDPGEHWAFGFDHSQDSLEDAARNAAIKCDKAREKFKVFTKAKIFAINDEVVYYHKLKR